MNEHLIERAVAALGPLVDEVVFVGGTTVELWVTDPGAEAVRPTVDVDVVVEVASRGALQHFEERLRAAGFRNDATSGVICRWLHGRDPTALIVDVMPTDPRIFGFANRWMPAAFAGARQHRLASGTQFRLIQPPELLASKLEAFSSRGGGDFYGSRDLEDIVTLVNGRGEIVGDVRAATAQVRRFIAASCHALLEHPDFANALPGFVFPEARIDLVVLPRLEALASLGQDSPGPR